MMQDHVEHFRREAALGRQHVKAAARVLAHFAHFRCCQRFLLVEDRDGNEGLADIVQQGGARQPALIVLAHAEVLRERDGEAGDEQAMAIGVDVMAADRGQPFAQRGMLDRLDDLALGRHDVAELQRHAQGKLLEDIDHHRMRGLDAPVQGLAAIGGVVAMAVRKRRADALQNGLRIERPGDGIGGAERPGLHRAVMKRVGQNEQPRHRAIGLRAQLVADQLDAFGRPQIDIDHDARELAGRVGKVGRRHGSDLAHHSQDAGQLAALVAPVRSQQQPAFGRWLGGWNCHGSSVQRRRA